MFKPLGKWETIHTVFVQILCKLTDDELFKRQVGGGGSSDDHHSQYRGFSLGKRETVHSYTLSLHVCILADNQKAGVCMVASHSQRTCRGFSLEKPFMWSTFKCYIDMQTINQSQGERRWRDVDVWRVVAWGFFFCPLKQFWTYF